MKITEDPWENFLYHDSKSVLPIMCHSMDMTIEEQVLVSMFIQKSVADETISQYSLQGVKLVNALITFVRDEYALSGEADGGNDDDEEDDIVDELLVSVNL